MITGDIILGDMIWFPSIIIPCNYLYSFSLYSNSTLYLNEDRTHHIKQGGLQTLLNINYIMELPWQLKFLNAICTWYFLPQVEIEIPSSSSFLFFSLHFFSLPKKGNVFSCISFIHVQLRRNWNCQDFHILGMINVKVFYILTPYRIHE